MEELNFDEQPQNVSNQTNYDDSNIQTLSPLEHIRLRPGMYVGDCGNGSHSDDGLYILIKEVLDNSIDEFRMKAGNVMICSAVAVTTTSPFTFGIDTLPLLALYVYALVANATPPILTLMLDGSLYPPFAVSVNDISPPSIMVDAPPPLMLLNVYVTLWYVGCSGSSIPPSPSISNI